MAELHNDVHQPLYTIGVVADLLDVSVPTLRKYEDANFILPFRTESNHRRYSQKDVEILTCVRRMIDDFGVSMKGLGRLLALIPCLAIKDCSPKDRANCDAYYDTTVPCWAAQTKQGACEEDVCRLCPVYDKASEISNLKEMLKSYIYKMERVDL